MTDGESRIIVRCLNCKAPMMKRDDLELVIIGGTVVTTNAPEGTETIWRCRKCGTRMLMSDRFADALDAMAREMRPVTVVSSLVLLGTGGHAGSSGCGRPRQWLHNCNHSQDTPSESSRQVGAGRGP